MKTEAGKARRESTLSVNRHWLRESMNPYYFISMRDEPKANAMLERELHSLHDCRRLVLADRENALIMALVNRPGTLYETLSRLREREISYAMISHSEKPLPLMEHSLEIQRFEFDRKSNQEILAGKRVVVPEAVKRKVNVQGRRCRETWPEREGNDRRPLLTARTAGCAIRSTPASSPCSGSDPR